MGRALVEQLVARGHEVRLLVRAGSERKASLRGDVVPGNALDAETFADRVPPSDTVVHLVGVSHPAPWKERAFRAIDLASLRASAKAARAAVLGVVFPASKLRRRMASRHIRRNTRGSAMVRARKRR